MGSCVVIAVENCPKEILEEYARNIKQESKNYERKGRKAEAIIGGLEASVVEKDGKMAIVLKVGANILPVYLGTVARIIEKTFIKFAEEKGYKVKTEVFHFSNV